MKVAHLGHVLGVTQGARLCVDSSVTESDIHYPTDSSQLNDAARVLSRLVKEARAVLLPQRRIDKTWFRDGHRPARRLAQQIGQLIRPRRKKAEKSSLKLSVRLLRVVEALLAQIDCLQPRLTGVASRGALGLHEMFDTYVPLVQRVIEQTRRRVLLDQTVTTSDKVVSLFEPHPAIICRGKANPRDTEFGHKL